MDEQYMQQEYEWAEHMPLYQAHIHFRNDDGPTGGVDWVEGFGATADEAARSALTACRREPGRITILSLHIARNRLRFFAAPLDLEEILAEERAKEKEAADAHD